MMRQGAWKLQFMMLSMLGVGSEFHCADGVLLYLVTAA